MRPDFPRPVTHRRPRQAAISSTARTKAGPRFPICSRMESASIWSTRRAVSRITGGSLVRLFRENFLDEVEGARVFGLAEPEDRLLAHRGVPVRAGYLDEQGDAFVFGHLRK